MMLNKLIHATPEPRLIEFTPTGSIAEGVPRIDLIPEGVHRPLWSVMIPTYNRTKYLEQALRSVLEQDPGIGQMQIEVVDNCSTEADIEAIVKRVGQNRVSFYRQNSNVGLNANLVTCMRRARGHLVHVLHDDDLVLPNFYSRLQEAFEQEPTIGAAFCRYTHVDEHSCQRYLARLERTTPGILSNWLERIAVQQLIQPPAIVVRRKVYEELGGLHSQLTYACDWEMWTRIAAHYPVWYEPQTLASYRVHYSSDSSDSVKSGKNMVDIRRAIEISQLYLPDTIADKLLSKAREYWAFRALMAARKALVMGDIATAIAQTQEALKCSFSVRVIGVLAILPILAVALELKKFVPLPLKDGIV